MLDQVEHVMLQISKWIALVLECMVVFTLFATGVNAFWRYFRHKTRVRMFFAKGMSTALSFKLASEIVRTVVVRDIQELIFVGVIIVLNAGLSFLIHWDIKAEEEVEMREKQDAIEEERIARQAAATQDRNRAARRAEQNASMQRPFPPKL